MSTKKRLLYVFTSILLIMSCCIVPSHAQCNCPDGTEVYIEEVLTEGPGDPSCCCGGIDRIVVAGCYTCGDYVMADEHICGPGHDFVMIDASWLTCINCGYECSAR